VRLEVETAPVVSAEQVKRYLYDIHLTLFKAEFRYYSFDVKQAWEDGIRQWWEGRHSPLVDILGPIRDALSWFWDHILKPPLEALLSGVRWALEQAIKGVSWIVEGIASTLGSLWGYLQSLGSWIWEKISSGISWLWNLAKEGFEAVKGGLSWLWSELKSGLEWVYNGVASIMSSIAEHIVSGLKGLLSIFEKVGEWIWNAIKAGANWIYEHFIEPIVKSIEKVWETIVGSLARAVYRWGHQDPEGAFERAMTVWTTATGLYLAARTGAQAVEALFPTKELGLDEYVTKAAEIGGLFAFGHTMYSTVYDAAVKVPLHYEAMSKYTPMIPGAGDLVRFELREVFRPEMRKEQLSPPPSEDFYKWMRYQGYDRYWADSYWAAHWELPSVSQAYEMFQRLRPGRVPPEHVFTEKDLRDLLKRLDILPAYHDRLIRIAYRPISRVDIRRMYRLGVLTEDGVKQAFLDLGYSPEDAEAMTRFTVLYETPEEKVSGPPAELKPLIKEGFWTAEMARDWYAAYAKVADPLEQFIWEAMLAYTYDYLMDCRSLILERLRRKKLTKSEALAQLGEVMADAERAKLLVELTTSKMKVEEELEAS
jgi:hypothetical protein